MGSVKPSLSIHLSERLEAHRLHVWLTAVFLFIWAEPGVLEGCCGLTAGGGVGA